MNIQSQASHKVKELTWEVERLKQIERLKQAEIERFKEMAEKQKKKVKELEDE
jgi:coenzyme F420-reducing hydrogenase delta subunit